MEINKSHIYACILGICMGSCLTFGILGVSSIYKPKSVPLGISSGTDMGDGIIQKKLSKFDQLIEDYDGNAYVTRSGKVFHSKWCGHLNNPNIGEIKQVNSSQAIEVGYRACSHFYR